MNRTKPAIYVVIAMIFVAAFSRLIPHWPNFTAVAAIALFGGAKFRNKATAFIVPLAALMLTDLILGFHGTMITVYVAFAITVVLGFGISRNATPLRIGVSAVTASALFFLITNFGSWLVMPLYSKDAAGLMMAYANGLAFFNNGTMGISPFVNTLLGDLFYTGILFGSYAVATSRIPALKVE